MRIEGKKFEFEDTIVWVFVMYSSVEWLQKGCICKLAPKKGALFSLMYFCESFCINRISHNYVIPQFLFCIIMPFRTSFHMPFRKLIPPFTLTDFSPSGIFFGHICLSQLGLIKYSFAKICKIKVLRDFCLTAMCKKQEKQNKNKKKKSKTKTKSKKTVSRLNMAFVGHAQRDRNKTVY